MAILLRSNPESIATPCSVNAYGVCGEKRSRSGLSQFVITSRSSSLVSWKRKLGGNEAIPSIESVKMRYTFFNYLKLEITCAREYFALAYYKIKGWI